MITWFYGNTGAGKTTKAKLLAQELKAVLLDADEVRECLQYFDLKEDGRRSFNLRVASLANLFHGQGHDVVVATICPYRDLREEVFKITHCEFIYLGYIGDDSIAGSPFERPGK